MFRVGARNTSGYEVELVSGSISAGEYRIEPPRWYITLDTTIGSSIIIDSLLDVQIGSQVYAPGTEPGESMDQMWFEAYFRLTPTVSFHDIEIVSEAGASTEPLPPLVPASSLPGRILLVLGLALGATVALHHRRHVAGLSR